MKDINTLMCNCERDLDLEITKVGSMASPNLLTILQITRTLNTTSYSSRLVRSKIILSAITTGNIKVGTTCSCGTELTRTGCFVCDRFNVTFCSKFGV
eukprot:4994079-Pyramimonas_sp.AAC.1